MPTLTFPIDISCARCGGTTTSVSIAFPQASVDEAFLRIDVEARCPGCGNHVIFGQTPARLES